MPTLEQLETALINADKAGDVDAARKLAAVIQVARQDKANQIPGVQVPSTAAATERTVGDTLKGAGEAALAVSTGATGGALGMIGGTLKGLAEQILSGKFGTPEAVRAVEQSAVKGAQALTYASRTESGQEQAAAVGEAMQNLIPIAPLAGEMGAIAAGTRAAAPAVTATAGRAVDAAKRGGQAIVEKVKAAATGADDMPKAAGGQASVGGMGVDPATLRTIKAEDLGFKGETALTQGQKTRDFSAQRFERETAKDPEMGAALRERFSNQNAKLQQVMDGWIDETGAEAPDLRSIGIRVDQAIRSRAARDKAKIRTLYKEAEKAGELAEPVDLSPVADYLNQNRAGRSSAPILQTLADELAVQEIGAGKLAEGNVTAGQATLQQAEALRKAVNKFTKSNDPNDMRVAADLKGLIDAATDGKGGALYRQARAARARYAKDYEDIGLVRNLIGQKKGSADRAIALEDVLNRSVIEPSASLDSLRQVRRLLQTEGENGKQAWRELQGGTLKYIRDQATKNVARNERGDPIVSAAQLDRIVTQLDKTGKLDFIFGRKGADQIRALNDIAKDVLVPNKDAVNTSNTASVILAAMDMAISGVAGVPAPVLSSLRLAAKGVKNAKTRAAVQRALGE